MATPQLTSKEQFAKGKRGLVSTALYKGKRVLVKERNPASAVNTIGHEALMLQLVNRQGIGPQFIALQDDMLIREFIDGEEIVDWITHADRPRIKVALLDILAQCRTLDEMGINKLEMTHPYKHILITKGKPVFIDFERAKQTQKPKNVTQVCQWLTGKDMAALLESKEVRIIREAMIEHAKRYKQSYSKQVYERMREVIANA